MKKLMYTLGAFAATAPMALLAEGGTSGSGTSSIVSMSDVTDIFTNAQEDMTSLLSAAIPVVVAFVGGGLIIWGAIALVGVLKRAFGAGKGR